MLRRIISGLLFLATVPVFGQVSFQFVPELHGRTIDGLLNMRIVNVSPPMPVVLTLAVSEKRHGKVVNIKTERFMLQKGSTIVPPSAARSAKIQFANSSVSRAVQQNGYFPEGDYEYCFTITPMADPNVEVPASPGDPTEQCFDYELVPSAPLSLIEPFDNDKICEKRPLLTWQPSLPQIPGSAFQLVLVEIKDRQNATEALNYNLPIVSQSGIVNPMLLYPPSARELVSGKKYAWQVSAYKNQTIINRSEVWEFTVDCEVDTAENKVIADYGYRDIEDLSTGNYYVAEGEVKYVIVNSYGSQGLKYKIICLTDPSLKIKRLPNISLKVGKNKVNVNLSNNKAFKDGYYYIIKVWLPNGAEKELRFLYKTPR